MNLVTSMKNVNMAEIDQRYAYLMKQYFGEKLFLGIEHYIMFKSLKGILYSDLISEMKLIIKQEGFFNVDCR